MRNIYILVIIMLLTVYGREANAMRCNGKLIRVGDYVHKMLEHCGEPVMVYYGAWGSRNTFIYEMNGREQRITVIDDVIKGGV